MTTDIKLNTYIEWTDKDRAKGECPVPARSEVTVWFADGEVARDCFPQHWDWGKYSEDHITAYLVHSVPREPIVRWLLIDEFGCEFLLSEKIVADDLANENGGRVVKLVEEM